MAAFTLSIFEQKSVNRVKMASNEEDETKQNAAKWLSDLGLSVTGTKEELVNRKRKYERYPKLVEKLRNRTKANRTFSTSLDPLSS